MRVLFRREEATTKNSAKKDLDSRLKTQSSQRLKSLKCKDERKRKTENESECGLAASRKWMQ